MCKMMRQQITTEKWRRMSAKWRYVTMAKRRRMKNWRKRREKRERRWRCIIDHTRPYLDHHAPRNWPSSNYSGEGTGERGRMEVRSRGQWLQTSASKSLPANQVWPRKTYLLGNHSATKAVRGKWESRRVTRISPFFQFFAPDVMTWAENFSFFMK